ncbi:MAG: DinB family protein [Lachnospiraceae bacterium]|nr:DinB family protein [Lachnospiraceae bacterium]
MNENVNPAIKAERNQFMSTYHMLKKMVDVCPDEVWKEYYYGVPFWYQVYHCVYFMDFWFRKEYKTEFIPLSDIGQGIPPEFEYEIPEEAFISRTDMKTYLSILEEKIDAFFYGIQDSDLGKHIDSPLFFMTYADIIASQNRHVMYNMGYLNGILRSMNLEESDWWAYNEPK